MPVGFCDSCTMLLGIATWQSTRMSVVFPHTPSPTRHTRCGRLRRMQYSLYKARNISVKQHVCAICVDRTRGKTQRLSLGYGVSLWLCEGHASVEFLTKRGGRDFVLTMSRLWAAHGCLTASRSKALNAHIMGLRSQSQRHRPGSYAWPRLRVQAEQMFAAGATANAVSNRLYARSYHPVEPPSSRTIQRWRQQRRWCVRGSPPAAGPLP